MDTTVLRQAAGRTVLVAMLVCDLVATGWLGGSERVVGLARSLAFPGIGFVEWQPLLASATMLAGATAVVAWLRWGADWLLAVVWIGAAAITWFVVPLHHGDTTGAPAVPDVLAASHEFAVVLVVMAAVARARVMLAPHRGSPTGTGSRGRSSVVTTVDRGRAATIAVVAGGDRDAAVAALRAPDVLRRAARVGRLARFRFGGDPLRADHAAVRAGLTLAGAASPAQDHRLRAECRHRRAGVPGSEPTWVRLLDGTLAALALDHLGEQDCVTRWRRTFDRELGLRHGRRRGALHTPSMLTIGTASAWEHATATALARRAGWIGDDDWEHLRRGCLGAAARGARTATDARLVASGRVWAAIVGDDEAARILHRPTLAPDEVAGAIARLADPAAAHQRP